MKKKLLSLAVTAGMLASVGAVQAGMHINDKGTGEALIYPFYSAQGGNDTYVHVVNTTNVTKAVKVRFIEASNSQEVLDFNLYLSPEDEWAAVITRNGTTGGAMVRTVDNSCTVPELGTSVGGHSGTKTTLANGKVQRDQNFVRFNYQGDVDNSIERTTAGYIEIIEMGQLDPNTGLGADAVHNEAGVPNNCGNLRAAWNAGGTWVNNPAAQLLPWDGETSPSGGLWGYGVVINGADGTSVGYDAVAIDAFNDPEDALLLHYLPGDERPSLAQAQPTATIFDGNDANDYVFPTGYDAVSALFMSANISNDYVVDPVINAQTNWVVTMPTKRFYVQGNTPVAPFTNVWSVKEGDDRETACESIGLEHWDREEAFTLVEGGFSPQPVEEDFEFQLCTEVSIIQFSRDTSEESVLHASDRIRYGFEPGYTEGWARISFDNLTSGSARSLAAINGDVFRGLPATGFAVINYQNGDLDGVLSNYGAAVRHKSEQVIILD